MKDRQACTIPLLLAFIAALGLAILGLACRRENESPPATLAGEDSLTEIRRTRRKQVVERDGEQIGGEYDVVSRPIHSPAGDSIAFPARTGNRWQVIRDGEPVGGDYDAVGRPVFSADGTSIAFPAEQGGEWFVVKDGERASDGYVQVSDVAINRDGTSLAFAGWDQRGCVVVQDGEPLTVHLDIDDIDELRYDPEGRLPVYRAVVGDEQFIVRGGEPITDRYPRIQTWTIAPDGETLALVATIDDKEVLIMGGRHLGEPFLAYYAGPLAFSPDSKRVAMPIKTVDGWHITVDGVPKDGPIEADLITQIVFCPGGADLAYAARSGDQWFVVKGDTRLDGRYDSVTGLRNSEDGTALVFAAAQRGTNIVVREPW